MAPPLQLCLFDGDAEAPDELAQAFAELHRHYVGDLAPDLETVSANLRDRVLAPGSGTRIALARADGRIAGLATFAILYPAPGARGQLFMKDLYVRAGWRGQGVGEALMGFLARHAVDKGCVRFDWTTERGNAGAIAFYDRLGASRVAEKLYFRLDGPALEALAAGGGDGAA